MFLDVFLVQRVASTIVPVHSIQSSTEKQSHVRKLLCLVRFTYYVILKIIWQSGPNYLKEFSISIDNRLNNKKKKGEKTLRQTVS